MLLTIASIGDFFLEVFEYLQKLSFRFFDNAKTGHLVARITTDLLTRNGRSSMLWRAFEHGVAVGAG